MNNEMIDTPRAPMISVLMSVYNTKEEYLRASIESILAQTFSDFEFIIFDDASDEVTKEVLTSYKDPRIVIQVNEENRGLTANLNEGLERARGKYIARMDSDDVSFSRRLEKCYMYMESHPDTNILGTYVKQGNRTIKSCRRASRAYRKALFMVINAGPMHPSAFIRKSFLDQNSIYYDEYYRKSQDFELWTRCIELTDIEIYPRVLLEYRKHTDQISVSEAMEQERYADHIKARMIKATGIEAEIDELERFVRSRIGSEMDYNRYKSIVYNIRISNGYFNAYDKDAVSFVTSWYLFKYVKNHYTGLRLIKGMIAFLVSERPLSFFYKAYFLGVE